MQHGLVRYLVYIDGAAVDEYILDSGLPGAMYHLIKAHQRQLELIESACDAGQAWRVEISSADGPHAAYSHIPILARTEV